MKKWIIYLIGVVTGFLLAFLVYVIFISDKKVDVEEEDTEVVDDEEEEPETKLPDGVTLFDEAGDVVDEESFKDLQVIASDAALVNGKDEYGYYGTLYLITNSDNKYYYDDEIVKVPQGKVVRQVGIYRYIAKNETLKTVPIIMILNE